MTKNNQQTCGVSEGFDYCFWAKVCVAVPVLPTVAVAAAGQFESPASQGIAAALAIFAVIVLARWIDRMPIFQKKIRLRK